MNNENNPVKTLDSTSLFQLFKIYVKSILHFGLFFKPMSLVFLRLLERKNIEQNGPYISTN